MSWFATNLVASFLLPPLNIFMLALAGLALRNRAPRLGRALVVSAAVLLYTLSTPYVADRLLGALETARPLNLASPPTAQAIVILGAGTYFDAPEYGGDTVNRLSLERLRYGARLHRHTGKPILVTGGNPAGGTPEGLLMKGVLEKDFGVPVRWTEDASRNTYENARFSRDILKPLGISRIYLVTQAWHMPRAVYAFRQAGFQVVPAPTGFGGPRNHEQRDRMEDRVFAILPRAGALLKSYYAMHEGIGLLWYRFR